VIAVEKLSLNYFFLNVCLGLIVVWGGVQITPLLINVLLKICVHESICLIPVYHRKLFGSGHPFKRLFSHCFCWMVGQSYNWLFCDCYLKTIQRTMIWKL